MIRRSFRKGTANFLPLALVVDPGSQMIYLILGKRQSVWRHPQFRILICDPFDQMAFLAVPRNDSVFAGVPTPQCSKHGVQTKLRFLRVGSVAVDAMLAENWKHILLKVTIGKRVHRRGD